MTRRTPMLVPALMLAVALSGCGRPRATPQATFREYRDAVARKDWRTSLGCLTPESQDKIVAGLVVGIATASIVSSDAAALLKKHGVNRQELMGNLMTGALANLLNPREAIGEGIRQCAATIAHKPAFFADGMTWLEENNKPVADKLVLASAAQLGDVRIDGDTATGTLSLPRASGETTLRFKRIEGRWLIDL